MTEKQKILVEAEIKRHRALAQIDPDRLEVANALQICYINAIRWEVMECRKFPASGRRCALCRAALKTRSLLARAARKLTGR